jgi:hypothetical protein
MPSPRKPPPSPTLRAWLQTLVGRAPSSPENLGNTGTDQSADEPAARRAERIPDDDPRGERETFVVGYDQP